MASNNSLCRVENWQALIHKTGYRARGWAAALHVSVRTLERHCQVAFGHSPHEIIFQFQAARVTTLAHEGKSGKEIATDVALATRANVARFIRIHMGCTLKELRQGSKDGCRVLRTNSFSRGHLFGSSIANSPGVESEETLLFIGAEPYLEKWKLKACQRLNR
jgi:AraC-like DNA-binding protein